MEVRDHEHGPPRLFDHEVEGMPSDLTRLALQHGLRGELLALGGIGIDRNRYFNDNVRITDRDIDRLRRREPIPFHPEKGGFLIWRRNGDPHHL